MSANETEISRVTRSKEDARITYDKISRWYDLLEGIWAKKAKDLGLEKLAAKPGEMILEIGFGTGYALLALAERVGSTGKVFGIDLSPKMLGMTQARVNKRGIPERVDLRCADAAKLPCEPNVFDAIYMSFVLELFDTPEIPIVVHECKRVLRRGGRICVVSLSETGKLGWMRRLYRWGHWKFPRVLDCRPIFVQKALSVNGFQIVDTSHLCLWGLSVEVVLAENQNGII